MSPSFEDMKRRLQRTAAAHNLEIKEIEFPDAQAVKLVVETRVPPHDQVLFVTLHLVTSHVDPLLEIDAVLDAVGGGLREQARLARENERRMKNQTRQPYSPPTRD